MLTRQGVIALVGSFVLVTLGGTAAYPDDTAAPAVPTVEQTEDGTVQTQGVFSESGTTPGGPSGASGGGAPVPDPCSYTQISAAEAGFKKAGTSESPWNEETTTTGSWYVKSCPGQPDATVWAPPAGAAGQPSPFTLAQQAYSSMTVTTPPIALNPFYTLEDGRNATLKNIETWVWIDLANWKPVTDRLEVGPVWIEVTAIPRTITVTPNDGVTEPMMCAGPGTPIPPDTPGDEPSPDCSLQFLEQTNGDTWPVTVSVTYSAAWVGSNGVASVSGELPDLVGAPVTIPLAVLTAKPQLVDPNGD